MLLKKGIRILIPKEVDLLVSTMGKKDYQNIFHTALYTGMRYEELRRFQQNPEWYIYERRSIHLPKEAVLKKKIVERERYIYLPDILTDSMMDDFFQSRDMPATSQWNQNLKMWANKCEIDDIGISAKATRKTWECWLCESFPLMIPQISMSQGHTTTVAMEHYIGIPFKKDESIAIKERTKGWKEI